MKYNFPRLWKFLTEDIWRIRQDEVKRSIFSLLNIIKTIFICIKRIKSDRLMNKAAALTYSTLLSIVPLIAVLFAIARGFGFDNIMESQIVAGLGGQSDAARVILELVNSYLANTKNGIFVGVGLILLLWTIVNLINNMEITFNSIWNLSQERSIYRKITDYFSMLLLIPIVIVVSGGLSIYIGSISSYVQNFALLAPLVQFLIKLIPFIFTWMIFTCLYLFFPNTKVEFKHALVSGILAGTAQQFLQYLYIHGQISVSKYNAIYGSFAALPLFLFWLQTSWIICLFGAQLTYCGQNIRFYNFDKDTNNISNRYREFVTIIIMAKICKAFDTGAKPYTAEELAEKYKLPIRLTHNIINDLVKKNILIKVMSDHHSEDIAYLPSIDINKLSVGYLLLCIDNSGSEEFKLDTAHEFKKEWEVVIKYQDVAYQYSNEILLKDLA